MLGEVGVHFGFGETDDLRREFDERQATLPHGCAILLKTNSLMMAEGVVSEPFLPSGDQGRKVGFAPLSKQYPILCGITNKMQAEIRFFSANFGCKTEGELGNAQKLGTRLDAAQQMLLAETQNPAALSLSIYRTLFHPSCAMLPFCDRRITVARKDIASVWTRNFPIAKEPTTLGQHLKKKRFLAGVRQREAALKLGVSNRTLSLWETDRVYPAWAFQPRLITYLGFDPFTDPTLGSPKCNEPSCVALLSPDGVTAENYRKEPEKGGRSTACNARIFRRDVRAIFALILRKLCGGAPGLKLC
jgi:DNA-binding XRE family transcriptional regulator